MISDSKLNNKPSQRFFLNFGNSILFEIFDNGQFRISTRCTTRTIKPGKKIVTDLRRVLSNGRVGNE